MDTVAETLPLADPDGAFSATLSTLSWPFRAPVQGPIRAWSGGRKLWLPHWGHIKSPR